MANDMICPVMVAKAAPRIPISNPNISIGSSMVLMMAPVSMDIIEYLGLPSAMMSLLIPVFAIRNGKPIAVILVYSCANGRTLSVAPNALSIGVRKMLVTRKSATPNIAMRQIPFPAASADLFSSPAPSFSEKLVALPIPRRSDMAVHAVDRGNAIFVAAFPSIPTPCPINIWSTIL